ncbi:hypothetical protein AVEN_163311-1 [Araneus ventricosus]|uniref:Uncharacterized protein n=1 Tax=Araneus ventricosus TaxID=182803 RepID=A0A4Y2N319_ARAVE|nr:hypothetical protein AVEN_163311-1 [Araneus ventricosus]
MTRQCLKNSNFDRSLISHHNYLKKSRSSGLTLNCKKDCLISAISPMAAVRNLNKSGGICSESLGPTLNHSLREAQPGRLKEASNTWRTLVVALDGLMSVLCGR